MAQLVVPQRRRAHSDFGIYKQPLPPDWKVECVDDSKTSFVQARVASTSAILKSYLDQPFKWSTPNLSVAFKRMKKLRKSKHEDVASSTDQESFNNSASQLPQITKSSSSSRSANTLHRHASYNGTDQLLYFNTSQDMKHKQVKNAKLKSQRNLSISTPVMPPSRTLTPDIEGKLTPHRSKSRNKKFHRIFKQVPLDEKVLNYFSCALLADILLQGHLYISENYFGFYSNVFGHVTRILIPVDTVIKVTKEKTARFIPNAVGVVTKENKHIFGSLLSRESTYRLMFKVWMKFLNPDPGVRDDSEPENICPDIGDGVDTDDDEEEEVDESGSGGELLIAPAEDGDGRSSSESGVPSGVENESAAERSCPSSPVAAATAAASPDATTPATSVKSSRSLPDNCAALATKTAEANVKARLLKSHSTQALHTCFQKVYGIMPVEKVQGGARSLVLKLISLPKPTLLLLLSTFLLIFLFFSATLLIYRLNALQQTMGSLDVWSTDKDYKTQIFQEVFKWQRQLHDSCVNNVQESLDTHIHQLVQVRRSLQTLLLLLIPDLPAAEAANKNSENTKS